MHVKQKRKGAVQENEGYRFRGRVWIDGSEGTFLGYGRVVLLDRIGQYGSITQAAKSMEISYRHAWKLVDSMNRQAPAPLVETATGGTKGGGARITAEGERAVKTFWKLYNDFQKFVAGVNTSLYWKGNK
ncbi:MAG: winged helix-turn-helix domain-containing protein [Thermodesulfovibrionales bacterium]